MEAERIDATGLVPERSDATRLGYIKKVGTIARSAAKDLGRKPKLMEAVAWFAGAHDRFQHSTIRQYRAAIREKVEIDVGRGLLSPDTTSAIEAHLAAGPRPCVGGQKRTSSRKRKSVRPAELRALTEHLRQSGSADDRFLLHHIVFSIMFFPRPCEWTTARRQGGALKFVNAKNSNGRSHGEARTIELAEATKATIEAIDRFLADLKCRVQNAGSYNTFARWLARRLTIACERARVRPLAPYSLRHIGMASAKRHHTAQVVGYLAGHATDRTATSHYAKARTGLRRSMPTVLARTEDIAAVRLSGRASRNARTENAQRRQIPSP